MWICKIKVEGEKFLLGRKAKKFNVDLVGYPLSHKKTKKELIITVCGLVFGEEKTKKLFFKDMENDKNIKKFEFKDDFSISSMSQPLESEPLYNPEIIYINPIIISKQGYIIWELASWEKKNLDRIIGFAVKYFNGKILKFKEEKISNISILRLLPELTKKQKLALEIAIKNGYYEVPKKITMEKLAKVMGVCFSTYQVHLSRAEKKIMPFMLQRT